MPIDRRRFLVLGALSVASACSKTAGDGDGYAATTSPPAGPTTTPLPPVATRPPTSATTSTSRASTSSTTERPITTDPPTTTTTSPPGPARFVIRAAGTPPLVGLTFHTNGDLGLAQRILDTARGHDARFTNFIVGDWLEANPSWATKLVEGGHELANHTYTHPTFSSLGSAGMLDEITRCRDVIARLTGHGGRFFRPSGTDDGTATPSPAILQAAADAGYGIVLGWDVEPFDYQDPGAAAVEQRVLADVRPGSVVSLHFGHQGTADALDRILTGLAAKGLRPVTMSELLSA